MVATLTANKFGSVAEQTPRVPGNEVGHAFEFLDQGKSRLINLEKRYDAAFYVFPIFRAYVLRVPVRGAEI